MQWGAVSLLVAVLQHCTCSWPQTSSARVLGCLAVPQLKPNICASSSSRGPYAPYPRLWPSAYSTDSMPGLSGSSQRCTLEGAQEVLWPWPHARTQPTSLATVSALSRGADLCCTTLAQGDICASAPL